MNPEKEPHSFKVKFKATIEKNTEYKVRIFKPPEFDTKLYDYYYFTEISKD
jgi:hypothetical protein